MSIQAAAAEELGILFAQNPVPMWVFDPRTLRVLAVNQAAERQYGYSAASSSPSASSNCALPRTWSACTASWPAWPPRPAW